MLEKIIYKISTTSHLWQSGDNQRSFNDNLNGESGKQNHFNITQISELAQKDEKSLF